MRKIKILQFPIAASNGGITHYAVENWKWMDKDRFQCDFATMSPNLPFADELKRMGSEIYYISTYAEDNIERFIKEFEHILSKNYDVVHLHTKQWKSITVEELCKKHGVPMVIVHAHSTKCDNNDAKTRETETQAHIRIRNELKKDMATDYWACSSEAGKWLCGENILSDVKIMKNAIDVDKFSFNLSVRNQLREHYGITNKTVIGNVGRLVYQKNHEFLLRAFAKAKDCRDDLVLCIVGDGPLRTELESLTRELGISEDIIFAGDKYNVNEYYQMFDLMVLPSRFEGLGIVLVEAQAAGLRCLAADNIPKEVQITNLVKYFPLNIDVWVNEMTKYNCCENRVNMKQIMTNKGFDIKSQIIIVENEYLRSTEQRYDKGRAENE
jgi:glycosyltransferase involved in cell wall biosynthesis